MALLQPGSLGCVLQARELGISSATVRGPYIGLVVELPLCLQLLLLG